MAGNPTFDNVVADEATKRRLEEFFDDLSTVDEAQKELAGFYDPYVSEMHPAKDEGGNQLYGFIIENLQLPHCARPQAVNLRAVLDETFGPSEPTTELGDLGACSETAPRADPDAGLKPAAEDASEPNVQKLREILLALIEDGNRHTYHDFDPPVWGTNSCARKARRKGKADEVYCRYLFPRPRFEATPTHQGEVRDDPHRTNLRNLFLARNDELINNFEEHVLLMNLGNVDWRPLINPRIPRRSARRRGTSASSWKTW